MPPSRPACGHDFPLFLINVTFLEGFFQGVFVAKLWPSPLVDDPLSAHRRRAALVACSACTGNVQTILAETVHLCLATQLAGVP